MESENLFGEKLVLWSWESEIVSIKEVTLFEQKNCLQIEVKVMIAKEGISLLTNGSRSQRPLLCIEGSQEYSGLWQVHSIEKEFIYCSFSHSTHSCSNIWSGYSLSKSSNTTCSESNLQLLSGSNPSTTISKVYLAPPLVFHTRVSIFNIDAVDTVNQTFRADVFAELRLKYIINCEDEEAILRLLECYQAMVSHIDFLNVAEVIGEKEVWSCFNSNQPGELLDYVMKIRLKAHFVEKMELENFPFDIQDLNIPITFNSPIHRVVLRPNLKYPPVFQANNFQLSSIFDVVFNDLVLSTLTSSDASESSAGIIYPRCVFTVYLWRKTGYYISNVVLPMGVLTLLSPMFCSIIYDGTSMGTADRVSITLTLLLTAVAYKFVVASSLPTVSYLTLLDSYVLMCFGFLCVNAVENVVYPLLVVYRGAEKSDEWMFVLVFYCLFLFINLLYGLNLFYWTYKRNEWKRKTEIVERLRRQVAKKMIGLALSSNMNRIMSKVLRELGIASISESFSPSKTGMMKYFTFRKDRRVTIEKLEGQEQTMTTTMMDFSTSINNAMKDVGSASSV